MCNVCFSLYAFLSLLSVERDALSNLNNVFTNIWFVFPFVEEHFGLIRLLLFSSGVCSFLAHLSTVYSSMPGDFDWYTVDIYFVILVLSAYAWAWIFPEVYRLSFVVCATAVLLLLLLRNDHILFHTGPHSHVTTNALLWILPAIVAFFVMLYRVYWSGRRAAGILLMAALSFSFAFVMYTQIHSLWHVWICTAAYLVSSLWRVVHSSG